MEQKKTGTIIQKKFIGLTFFWPQILRDGTEKNEIFVT